MSTERIRHLFTISDYHRMFDNGILREDSRVELINGEIIDTPPIDSHHAGVVNRINNILNTKFANIAIVGIQNPVTLDDASEPQPDISILKLNDNFYFSAHPKPADVYLLIEVAESTTHFDRTVKLPLYAQANISEAWLIDLNKSIIVLYRDPLNGIYQQILIRQRGQQLTALAFPNIQFTVDELIG